MTALVTLEREKLSKVLTTVPYHALAGRVVIGLRGGERMTVADLLRGLLLASANDAAATLAARVGGSQQRLRRADEPPRARSSGCTHTHYANADRARRAGQLLERRGPGQADADPAPQRVLPRGDQPAARDAAHRARTRARSSTATCSCARCPRSTASRPATRRPPATSSSARPRKNGVTVISVVLDEPSEAARDAGLARAHPLRPEPLPPRRRRCARGRPFATRQARPPRRARAARGGPHRRAHGAARRAPARPRARRARASSTARCRPASRVGTIEVRWRGRTIASVPLVTRTAIAAGLPAASAATTSWAARSMVVILCALALASLQLVLLRRRAVRRRRRQERSSGIA